MARRTAASHLVNDAQNDILCGHTERQIAADIYLEIFGLILLQALCSEHVFDFARSDPERQCAESTVGRRMRITANDRRTRMSEALFGSENVDDPLLDPVEIIQPYPEFRAVFTQGIDLFRRDRIVKRQVSINRG